MDGSRTWKKTVCILLKFGCPNPQKEQHAHPQAICPSQYKVTFFKWYCKWKCDITWFVKGKASCGCLLRRLLLHRLHAGTCTEKKLCVNGHGTKLVGFPGWMTWCQLCMSKPLHRQNDAQGWSRIPWAGLEVNTKGIKMSHEKQSHLSDVTCSFFF